MRIRNIIKLKYKSKTSKAWSGKIYTEKIVNNQNYIIKDKSNATNFLNNLNNTNISLGLRENMLF